jgi:endonuclease YncB( thermonuclease family)
MIRFVTRAIAPAVRALVMAGVLLGSTVALAERFTASVVGITDGDTLTVLTQRREEVRIRLSDIDSPERGQPYGERSRQALAGLAFGRSVVVDVRDTDRYGRTVARIHAGPLDVNAEMVRQGAAWVYRRYSDDVGLLRLEALARSQRRGLWALPEAQAVPPWDWRAAARHR